MATKESIQKLVESNRYSPDIIPELEKYVASQVANKTHDTEANLALLKLYQFYPEKNNSQVVANILLKAIMNFPSTDFMLALYLISEKTQSEEKIAEIIAASDLLERASFKDFWARTKAQSAIYTSVPGFEDAVREFIAGVVSKTYKSASKDLLKELLNVVDFEAFAKNHEWKIVDSVVQIPVEQSTPKSKTAASDSLRYEQFGKILHAMK